MNVIFCKITSMKYYKGVTDFDKPYKGGEYVRLHGKGCEVWNFCPTMLEDGHEACFGFVEPKHTRGVSNTIHIEKITGNTSDKKVEAVDDILVIWCAPRNHSGASVVGWYKNAKFYRELQDLEIEGNLYPYNVFAYAENCVLLPRNERDKGKWDAPISRDDRYGFGSSMLYYPKKDGSERKVKRILDNIDEYDGLNWLYVYNKEQEPHPKKEHFWQN